MKTWQRDVIAIDGEGITIENGDHLYTLLLAYDSRPTERYPKGRSYYIEEWQHGLPTQRILEFLLHLGKGKHTIIAAYYFNYDVAMWVKEGLSENEKTTLWRSGWVVWSVGVDMDRRSYFLRYIPNKLFFVGRWNADMGTDYDMYHWTGDHLLIFDVSGFAQTSFVKAIKDWDVTVDIAAIAAMKEMRGKFTAADREEIIAYCEQECWALAEYVQALDRTFRSEGITLRSWHGGGALATHFLRKERVDKHVHDPTSEATMAAILRSYFGGRNEICRAGRILGLHDYDINSAYPAATCLLPGLTTGVWDYRSQYDADASYAIWRVQWDTRRSGRRIGPLPFRWRKGVYFPDEGRGWYHASEIRSALRWFGQERDGQFRITGGWVYTDQHGRAYNGRDVLSPYPCYFVSELAGKRVAYKATDPKRAVPYKYGINSLYGKFAQHATDVDKIPPFRSYYAAGFVTAWTRARLLDFIYSGGHDDNDLIMLATDGVFCLESRDHDVGSGLGEFTHVGSLDDCYLVQPGLWYDRTGGARSRGFHVKSSNYAMLEAAWQEKGIYGEITFPETRFVGLGMCAGVRDFEDYGRWITADRTIAFYPERKFIAPFYTGREESVALVPMSMRGMESEPYTPARTRDESLAFESLAQLMQVLTLEDQPDILDADGGEGE